MNFIATYLAHHRYDSIAFKADESIYQNDLDIINRDTDINNIVDINKPAKILVLHNYLANSDELYDVLAKSKYEDVLLYYDDEKLDYFRAWEALRNNARNITIILQKPDRRRDILCWQKDDHNDLELSVIFPVYNVEKYIKQCIDTVTNWKAPYIEFIFVSDGSKDASVNIIKEAMKSDKRIRLIEKENGGCASARQVGLEAGKGRYVGFIDPDDFVDPSMFKKLLARVLLGDLDIAVCGYNEYYNNSGESKPVKDLIEFPYTWGLYERKDIDPLIAYLRIGIWRGIYKKKMIDDNNIHFYTDLPRYDDLPFKVETLSVAERVATIDEYLYYYRLEREGQTVATNDKKLFVHFDIFKHLDVFFKGRSEEQQYYYRIVKRDTHNWALSKIDKKYRKEYLNKMKEENRNG